MEDINIYDVYGICYPTPPPQKENSFELYGEDSTHHGHALVGDEIKRYKKYYTQADYTPWLLQNTHKKRSDPKKLRELPACTFGEPLIEYFNDATVRSQLHIPVEVQAWDMCAGDGSLFHYTPDYVKGSQWVYENLKGKYRMLFYSGDTDGAVPTDGSLQWIAQLNRTVITPWDVYMVDDQVGGYYEEYDGLTFVTVHGAGHMVPQFKRPQAYHVIFNWIKGLPF